MGNFSDNLTDFRLLLPEVIWLKPEHFEQARETRSQVRSEAHQWQTYLNALALQSLEEWLKERIPNQPVSREKNVIDAGKYLKVGEFKFWVIATENLLEEVVNVPQKGIDNPEETANFYVLLEILEEQEEVIIRGFLRYDQIVNYRNKVNLQLLDDGCYQLPLSEFDAEPNHLLYYCRFLDPTAIPLGCSAETKAEEKLLGHLKKNPIKLSQWLQGVFDEGWQAVDALINPEANLALSIRNVREGAKRCKLIDLEMQLDSQTVALLVNISEAEEKLGILIQLHPMGGERYLPPDLKLTLLSKAGKTLQQVQARDQDNYIQLKPFKGEAGKRFSIEVSLLGIIAREDFEL